jgi:hypothetical protein
MASKIKRPRFFNPDLLAVRGSHNLYLKITALVFTKSASDQFKVQANVTVGANA